MNKKKVWQETNNRMTAVFKQSIPPLFKIPSSSFHPSKNFSKLFHSLSGLSELSQLIKNAINLSVPKIDFIEIINPHLNFPIINDFIDEQIHVYEDNR
jgi:hypothetical protein